MNRALADSGRALALAAALLTAPPASAQVGGVLNELQSVAQVRIEGRRALGGRQWKAIVLKTRRPSRLPWREKPSLRMDYLRADTSAISALYRHHGFLDARVAVRLEPMRQPGEVRVVFHVDEGPRSRVASVRFAGVTAFHERELSRELLSRVGRPFDPATIQLDTLEISRLYQERGYLPHVAGGWDRPPEEPTRVDVRFGVTEGEPYRVGELSVVRDAGSIVEPRLAAREMLQRPGDTFRRSRLDQSVERLYATGLYSQVQVTSRPDSSRRIMDLDLRVRDRRARWVDAGVGSGTTERIRVSGEWGHHNLLGRGLRGVLGGRLAYLYESRLRPSLATAEASVLEPWLFGVRLSGQGAVFTSDIHDYTHENFFRRELTYGYRVALFREFSRVSRVTVQQVGRDVRQVYAVEPGKVLRPEDADTIRAALPRYRTNLLQVLLERDFRDNRVLPARGSYQTYTAEFAGGALSGTSNYTKHVLQSLWYAPLANGWTLAARAAGGATNPYRSSPQFSNNPAVDLDVLRVPSENRFRLGGVNSLRGYPEGRLPYSPRAGALGLDGGLAYLQFSLEARIPLAGPFGMEIYADAGNAWERPEYILGRHFVSPWSRGEPGSGQLRYAYGIGGRLNLPFGPLRVDASRRTRRDLGESGNPVVLQFAIGPAF